MSEVKILDGNTFVVSDDRGDIEASPDRCDRPLLVRHSLPLDLGADGERRAAQRALGRRPPVLRDPLLSRARNGHRLHRREAVRDSPARRRRRLPRRADDPQSQRQAGAARGSPRCGLRLRGSVRGQGCAEEERQVLRPGHRRTPRARLRAEDVQARDLHLGVDPCQGGQERLDVHGSVEASGLLADRAGRRALSSAPTREPA